MLTFVQLVGTKVNEVILLVVFFFFFPLFFFCKMRKQTASTHGDVTEQWGNAVLPSSAEPFFTLSYFLCFQYLQVNSRDKQSEMKSSRSLGDLKGSLLKGSERVRKHSTGELPCFKKSVFMLFLLVFKCERRQKSTLLMQRFLSHVLKPQGWRISVTWRCRRPSKSQEC